MPDTNLKQLSKDLIEKHCPNELKYFDVIWEDSNQNLKLPHSSGGIGFGTGEPSSWLLSAILIPVIVDLAKNYTSSALKNIIKILRNRILSKEKGESRNISEDDVRDIAQQIVLIVRKVNQHVK